MPPMPRILSIQVGTPAEHGKPDSSDPLDEPFVTALWKSPVTGPVRVGKEQIAGDAQADRKVHGGPDKAIFAYPSEHLPFWRAELAPDFGPGSFGENFTTEGLVETATCLGDVYRAGSIEVQVSQPRSPCWKLERRFHAAGLVKRILRSGRTGFYLRVLREGEVEAGAELTLVSRPLPEWTIAAVNEVRYGGNPDPQARRALAGCELLAKSWREAIARMLAGD